MKKIIVSVAVLVVVCIVAMPYVTGSIAEKETRLIVEKINARPLDYGVTEITSYERGFRSSQVVYEYQLPPSIALTLGFNEAIIYQCNYTHGLTGIDYACDFLANKAYQDFINDSLDGENPLEITGAISAFGGFDQRVATKPINRTLEDGSILKLSASELVVSSDASFASFKSIANIGPIEIVEDGKTMVVGQSELRSTAALSELGLFVGEYDIVFDAIAIKSDESDLDIAGLRITGSSTERGDQMDSVMALEFDRFAVAGVKPTIVEAGKISADFLGVNSQALADYLKFAENLQTDIMANAEYEENADVELDANQFAAMLPIVEEMLDKELDLALSMKGNIDGNPNSVNFSAKLLEKTSFTQLSAIMFNPESVLKNMDIKIGASLNQNLIQSAPAANAMISKSPLFISEKEVYRTEIKLGSEVEVNGKELSFQELQAMVLSGVM